MLTLASSLAMAAATAPWAPFERPWFDTLGMAEGLPQWITTAVVQDRRGLIWVGTMGGLARYDGYRVQVFENATASTPGLPDVYVRAMLALRDGGLLIGTNAGGLVRFDPVNDSFHAYPIGVGGTADRKIYALADDHHGGVWIASDGGVDHLDLASNVIRHLDTSAATAQRDFSVLQDHAGNLWLGNNNGLFVRRLGSDHFERVTAGDPAVSVVLHDKIWSLYEDRQQRIWVGSVQAGAAWRSADGTWHALEGFSGSVRDAGLPTVRAFLETADGRIWIATDGRGVLEYAPDASPLRVIIHDPAVASSLPGDSVRALLQDRSQNLWAATDLGLARTDPLAATAFSVLPSPLEQRALANANVDAVLVDRRGRIWIGESAGHIDLIDLQAGSMQHLRLPGAQSHSDVQAFAEVDGVIWVGGNGLARIDPDSLAVTASAEPQLNGQRVLSLQVDGATLLVGTYEGVYRYDTHTGALSHFAHQRGDPTSLVNDTVWNIARVGSELWYGTAQGISVATTAGQNTAFVNLLQRSNKPDALAQDYIGSIAEDPRGRVWVATQGGVAVTREPVRPGVRPRFRTIGPGQGLGSNDVEAVLTCAPGAIWASLSNGIARIDADTLVAGNLGLRDGLHVTTYTHTAAAIDAYGNLLFGGLGGLTVIRPQPNPPALPPPKLAVTYATISGKPLAFGALPDAGRTITLGPRSRNLRVDFSLLDYRAPMETAYSYQLDGADEGWNLVPRGNLPSAIYTNLPHGHFTLRLRASTRGLYPMSTETDLTVVVQPRWYQTTLARVLGLLLLVGVFVLLMHLRTLFLRRQAAQLQRRIDEQTHDLRAANLRLDELAGTDGLTGVYNRRRFMELAVAAMDQPGPICMALFDLDRFKRINDGHGHLAGDAVIRHAVEVIRRHCRQGDLVGRYGGEEFVLCLPGTQPAQAYEVVERIRAGLADTPVAVGAQAIRVTLSVGVASRAPAESIEQWLSRTDEALYEAKREGRNRSRLAI